MKLIFGVFVLVTVLVFRRLMKAGMSFEQVEKGEGKHIKETFERRNEEKDMKKQAVKQEIKKKAVEEDVWKERVDKETVNEGEFDLREAVKYSVILNNPYIDGKEI